MIFQHSVLQTLVRQGEQLKRQKSIKQNLTHVHLTSYCTTPPQVKPSTHSQPSVEVIPLCASVIWSSLLKSLTVYVISLDSPSCVCEAGGSTLSISVENQDAQHTTSINVPYTVNLVRRGTSMCFFYFTCASCGLLSLWLYSSLTPTRIYGRQIHLSSDL